MKVFNGNKRDINVFGNQREWAVITEKSPLFASLASKSPEKVGDADCCDLIMATLGFKHFTFGEMSTFDDLCLLVVTIEHVYGGQDCVIKRTMTKEAAVQHIIASGPNYPETSFEIDGQEIDLSIISDTFSDASVPF